MKLVTFIAPGGAQHIGALLPGDTTLVDFTASDTGAHFRDMLALTDGGDAALDAARALLAKPGVIRELASVKRMAPVPVPRRMSDLPPLPDTPPGRYRHYKGGEYEVVGVARHSETLEPLVVYRPLYNATGLWVRPHAMFFGQVEVDGRMQARFARLDDGA